MIGINLLREGLDIPECMLMAILDADKEGFLRSKTSLVQTIGRAARNADGRVILYADKMTGSMQYAIDETDRRREKQKAYNEEHGIIPKTIKRDIAEGWNKMLEKPEGEDPIHGLGAKQFGQAYGLAEGEQELLKNPASVAKHIEKLKNQMHKAAADLEFEEAARIRDQIKNLEAAELSVL